jgi:hypothetical protein
MVSLDVNEEVIDGESKFSLATQGALDNMRLTW